MGAPWGAVAMGGKFPGKFPPHMRVAALVQALVLSFLGLVVPIRSGLVFSNLYAYSNIGIWVVVAVFCLSLIMNLATPSIWERLIWAPVVAMLLACALLVAIL